MNELVGALARTRARKIGRLAGVALACVISVGATNAHTHSNREIHQSRRNQARAVREGEAIIGKASWYGRTAAGRKTATGERLDPDKLTAASTQLPLQSRALVTNLDNGRSVRVRINDCGPYVKGRKIDLSKRAAEKLAMTRSGAAPVKIKLIATPPDAVYCPPLRHRAHHHRRHYSRHKP